ncbi:replication restart helicase PriA [Blautia sp. MSJ-9]|uniref:replication restart helicase PriA n=1 Tax=Blautia sp. MSJ-9 TaxID=2841511 RepID=UPI001C11D5D6|nr:primosomal protein N' [Blautia sp. MSJ-9]MBU5679526.1 primosomal protein N' [Blautia sp. MSJ-9]
MIYADIIIDISSDKLDRSFQYKVPERLEQEIKVGMVVSIPFGNASQLRKGYVTGFSKEPKIASGKLKEICEICSGEETTESRLIALAAWMKENYGSTMIQALKTVLPIQEKIKAKERRYICLNISEDEGYQILADLEKTRFRARTRLLKELLEKKRLDSAQASKKLGATSAVIKKMQEQGIIRIEYDEILRNSMDTSDIPAENQMLLTQEQEIAVQQIREEWEKQSPRPVLIEGVTGSGKTQVYMKLIEWTISRGEQAIVLIPEIALTYQTVRRFYARFGDKVSVINSRQSQGERYDQFKRAKRGEVQVMIGPRSALFTPFGNLGLIVIDEEHEPSYKSESSPRYHARETAIKRAELEHARVVLGSATPSVEAYSQAKKGAYGLVRLNARYGSRPMPQVSIVDLREELKAGNRSVLSRELREKMKARFEKKEQVMLFLNRRGYAGFVSCRSCGQVMKCPHCDVALSEHNNDRLLCHYCGYETRKPQACPVCGSPYIGGFKAGTQQIEKVVRETFQGVRTLRMDFDTTRTKGSYEKILASFAKHEADVLIGTQMIVKGHDFPDVTLVGVVAADLSLNAEDYRCAERTFQLLCQAAGRGGRGEKPGEAVIQTYQPDHYSIQAAAVQDYQAFYEEEMSYRMLLDYPPAAHMLAVLGSGPEDELLVQAMHYLKLYVQRIYKKNDLHVIGPAYAAVGKVKDIYRQVIYLKHEDYQVLVWIKDQLEKYIEINSGFRKLYIQFDFQ